MERRDEAHMSSVEIEAVDTIREEDGHLTSEETLDLLPNALNELLERLDGKLSPGSTAVKEVPNLMLLKYGDYFREGGCDGPTRTGMRRRVLQALGNCKTLKRLSTSSIEVWNLSVEEWGALLVPLQTNAQLEEIDIMTLKSAEIESLIGPLWQKLIEHAENLSILRLRGNPYFCGLRAKLAAEVASGLHSNSSHKLERLSIEMEGSEDASVVLPLAEIIYRAPELKNLHLIDIRQLDGGEKEALVVALGHCHHLEEMRLSVRDQKQKGIGDKHEGIVDVLLEVYSGPWSNLALQSLCFEGEVGLTAEEFVLLIRSNISTIHGCSVLSPHLKPDQWRNIGRSLLHAPTLDSVSILLDIKQWPKEDLESLSKYLAELWKASEKSPLLLIDCRISFDSWEEEWSTFLQRALTDTYLTGIHVSFAEGGLSDHVTCFVDSLASNTSVESLDIGLPPDFMEICTYLFNRLCDNSSIRKLRVSPNSSSLEFHDDNFKDLMDLLEVTVTPKEIEVQCTSSWGNDGTIARIDEALRRERWQENYFSAFRRAELRVDTVAPVGHVLLCGSAFAGKTQLKAMILKILHLRVQDECLFPKKNEMAEKTMRTLLGFFCSHGDLLTAINILELAEQDIIGAFRTLRFPMNTKRDIFVYVFSPLLGKSLKGNVYDTFGKELRSWLRIISHTHRRRVLPQVRVVVTHKDKVKNFRLEFSITYMINIVMDLRDKYKDLLDLCPTHKGEEQPLYYVNAKALEEVEDIADMIFTWYGMGGAL